MDLLETLKKTGDALVGGGRGEADILATLKREHDEVGALLKSLVESDGGAERKALLKKVKLALVPHMKAEQTVVYDAVLALKEDEAKRDGEEGYLEHKLATNTLNLLAKIDDAMSPEFSAAAKVLKELIEHHVEEEERAIWSDVRDNFTAEQRAEMTRVFEKAKKRVRIKA